MNTSVKFCGVEFKNPIITASGTCNFGMEQNEYFDISELGGICVKGLTLKPREGNPSPRIAETPAGILNSVGLQNPGVKSFVNDIMPIIKGKTNIIANIAGSTQEEYEEMAEILSDSDVDIIEVNLSCPNVKAGGVAFGTDPKILEQVTRAVRNRCKKPIAIKLTPNVTSIADMAKAAEAGGADAVSLINTLLGMKIDVRTRRPVLFQNTGGLSGPAVKPVAVRMVWQVKNAVSIPIIGMGGIATGEDAAEFMLAGATLTAVGTMSLVNPDAPYTVVCGFKDYMKKYGIENAADLIGGVIPN